MIDTCMSRSDSHAFASCSSPCASQNGSRRHTAHTYIHRTSRAQPSASHRQPTMMASGKKEGGKFNPFRNKKKEVRQSKHNAFYDLSRMYPT